MAQTASIEEADHLTASPYLTMSDVTKRYRNVHRTTIYKWIEKEGFPKAKLKIGNRLHWLLSDIEEYDLNKIKEQEAKN